jgi:hypothetical protein
MTVDHPSPLATWLSHLILDTEGHEGMNQLARERIIDHGHKAYSTSSNVRPSFSSMQTIKGLSAHEISTNSEPSTVAAVLSPPESIDACEASASHSRVFSGRRKEFLLREMQLKLKTASQDSSSFWNRKFNRDDIELFSSTINLGIGPILAAACNRLLFLMSCKSPYLWWGRAKNGPLSLTSSYVVRYYWRSSPQLHKIYIHRGLDKATHEEASSPSMQEILCDKKRASRPYELEPIYLSLVLPFPMSSLYSDISHLNSKTASRPFS